MTSQGEIVALMLIYGRKTADRTKEQNTSFKSTGGGSKYFSNSFTLVTNRVNPTFGDQVRIDFTNI